MKKYPFDRADLDLIATWDTPTICNALEVLDRDMPLTAYTTRPAVTLDPCLPPMIGLARVGTIRAREPAEHGAVDRFDWYDYVAEAALPTIIILQDLDEPAGVGAFWGEVHSNVHFALGARGCITNGTFRDVTNWPKGFQMIGGGVCPSHAHVHLVDFGKPVLVLGMSVSHDALVHADQHGAAVIPYQAVKRLPEIIDGIAKKEQRTLELCRDPNFSPAMLRSALKTAPSH